MKLFSGTANKKLSEEIAKKLKIKLAKSEVVQFGNSEIRVCIQEKVRDQECFIVQSTSNPTDNHLMELFFYADALKRNEAKKIIGFIPYFGYARQNREHRPGESVSVNVIIRFLETVGFDEIYTFDIHDEGSEGIFTIPFKNLSVLPNLAKYIKKNLDAKEINKTVIISPDQGGIERTKLFATSFYGKNSEIGVIEKKRDLNKIHNSQALELFGNVKSKIVILVDDVITSGGTLINAAKICLDNGAIKVYAAISHHDFSLDAPKKLQNSSIEKIFSSNTIELKTSQKFPKLEEISIAEIITQELKKH